MSHPRIGRFLQRFARRRTLAATVVTVLALGIGANATLVSLVDRLLFRPLPVPGVERLVRIFPLTEEGQVSPGVSHPEVVAIRQASRTLDGLAGFAPGGSVHIAAEGQRPARVSAEIVTGDYFPLLGVAPAQGRLLLPADDERAAAPVAVLAHHYWRSAFGGDRTVVGRVVRVNRNPVEVVGVAPPGFVGASLESPPDLWLPAASVDIALPQFAPLRPLDEPRFSWLYLLGRLAPGVTADAAAAELASLPRAFDPESDGPRPVRVVPAAQAPLHPDDLPAARRLGWMLTGVGALLLLLAAAVAGSLLLVDGERRRRELAVHLSLGASRKRVASQLLLEAGALAAVGAVAAFWVAWGTRRALASILPSDLPLPILAGDGQLGPRLLLFCTLAGVVAVLIAGVAPAVRGSRADLSLALKGAEGTSGGRPRMPARHAFVVVQVALSAAVLVVSLLLLRTMLRVTDVDPGFTTKGARLATIDLSRQGYDADEISAFWRKLVDNLSTAPGVEVAALATHVPVQSAGMRTTVQPGGYLPARGEDVGVPLNIITPRFFEALDAPMVKGRAFTPLDREGSQAVAIVNEAFVRRFWEGTDGVGRIIHDVGPDSRALEVVGVVRDHRTHSLREPAPAALYLPLSQARSGQTSAMTAVLRGPDAGTLNAAMRRGVAALDPEIPLFDEESLEAHVGNTVGRERALAALLGGLGTLSLVLALLGLYAVLAFAVESRAREIGVRAALGATRRGLAALVVGQGLRLTGVGIVLGSAAAWVGSRSLAALLFGVTPHDPLSLLGAAALLVAVATLAAWLPARRAGRIDPVEALRR